MLTFSPVVLYLIMESLMVQRLIFIFIYLYEYFVYIFYIYRTDSKISSMLRINCEKESIYSLRSVVCSHFCVWVGQKQVLLQHIKHEFKKNCFHHFIVAIINVNVRGFADWHICKISVFWPQGPQFDPSSAEIWMFRPSLPSLKMAKILTCYSGLGTLSFL